MINKTDYTYPLTEEQLVELWKEILETAVNGDFQYSLNLFKETYTLQSEKVIPAGLSSKNNLEGEDIGVICIDVKSLDISGSIPDLPSELFNNRQPAQNGGELVKNDGK